MKEIWMLTNRNVKNFLRDKASVFFSFLSVIILIGIYILFIGRQFDDIEGLTSTQKSLLLVGFMMGGALVIGTLTTSLGIAGMYVNDLQHKKINGFLVLPVERQKLVLSYFFATVLVSLALTLLMLFFTILYLGLIAGFWYGFAEILKLVLTCVVFVGISSSFIMFVISFIKTTNAFATMSSLIGTLIGFLSGAYISLSMFGGFTLFLATSLPFSHMTIFLRKLMITPQLFNILPQEQKLALGLFDLKFFGLDLSALGVFAISIVIGIGLLFIAYYRMNKKQKS